MIDYLAITKEIEIDNSVFTPLRWQFIETKHNVYYLHSFNTGNQYATMIEQCLADRSY